jgi:hypothetical protein
MKFMRGGGNLVKLDYYGHPQSFLTLAYIAKCDAAHYIMLPPEEQSLIDLPLVQIFQSVF